MLDSWKGGRCTKENNSGNKVSFEKGCYFGFLSMDERFTSSVLSLVVEHNKTSGNVKRVLQQKFPKSSPFKLLCLHPVGRKLTLKWKSHDFAALKGKAEKQLFSVVIKYQGFLMLSTMWYHIYLGRLQSSPKNFLHVEHLKCAPFGSNLIFHLKRKKLVNFLGTSAYRIGNSFLKSQQLLVRTFKWKGIWSTE